MMEDIRKKFVPRFAALAKERIEIGKKVAADNGDAQHLARELHSLAGEAGLLGFTRILELARHAEEAAARLYGTPGAPQRRALEKALDDLHVAVSEVERKLGDPI
jgi:HPt (histidine-containing phosphotransfer) domain-containing protein